MKKYLMMWLMPLLLIAIAAGCQNRAPFNPVVNGTPTITSTFTQVVVSTATRTATKTATRTLTKTATQTSTATKTATNQVTGTATATITNSPTTPPFVELGTATNLGSFGGGAGVTNQGLDTVIYGDLGTTGSDTMITGFHDSTAADYTVTTSNNGNVTGRIYYDGYCTSAHTDAVAAYTTLSTMAPGTDPSLSGDLGGLTLLPGTYTAASGQFIISSGDLVLNANGNANAVWVFQMSGEGADALTVGNDVAPHTVSIINGGSPKNVYWAVSGGAVINYAGGGTMLGTIITNTLGITISNPDNATGPTMTTLYGRAISLLASVTMVQTIIWEQ